MNRVGSLSRFRLEGREGAGCYRHHAQQSFGDSQQCGTCEGWRGGPSESVPLETLANADRSFAAVRQGCCDQGPVPLARPAHRTSVQQGYRHQLLEQSPGADCQEHQARRGSPYGPKQPLHVRRHARQSLAGVARSTRTRGAFPRDFLPIALGLAAFVTRAETRRFCKPSRSSRLSSCPSRSRMVWTMCRRTTSSRPRKVPLRRLIPSTLVPLPHLSV